MSTYVERLAEERRLLILRLLDAAPSASGSAAVLHLALIDEGRDPSLAQVEADLAWLAEQGLVAMQGEHLPSARITPRGVDVAQGRARVPGVRRHL